MWKQKVFKGWGGKWYKSLAALNWTLPSCPGFLITHSSIHWPYYVLNILCGILFTLFKLLMVFISIIILLLLGLPHLYHNINILSSLHFRKKRILLTFLPGTSFLLLPQPEKLDFDGKGTIIEPLLIYTSSLLIQSSAHVSLRSAFTHSWNIHYGTTWPLGC